ncbi:MAG: protein phosphatase CheZ [Proteobacteria bacterium]|nr:protein phosphatase CheZ [Pseudomonadota bacterium]
MAKLDLSDDDYFAIEDALLNSARGRAFLRMRDERQRVVSIDEARRIASSFREWTIKQIGFAKETQSLDVLRAELQSMASHIQTAKSEIASIYNKDPKVQQAGNRINAATSELDQIVASTERATSDILNAAERIMEIAGTLPAEQSEAGQTLTDQATEIFTACSFQDITGQRISKVVSTLRYIDQRVAAMVAIWGPENITNAQARTDEGADQRRDAHLLNGPAMPGQGHTQVEIDALLAGAAAATPAPAVTTIEAPAPAPIKAAPPPPPAPPPAPKPPPATVPAPAATGVTASQADIDKLFD